MTALTCALCGRPSSEVDYLVANDADRAVCTGCLSDGCPMLQDPSRLYLRRSLLEQAASGADVDARLLEPLIASLPSEPVRSYLAKGQDGHKCVLCNGWGAGWQGIASDNGSVCGACILDSIATTATDSWLRLEWALHTFDARAPNTETGPVLAAMLSLAQGADDLRTLHDAASRVWHSDSCRVILERIPAAERTDGDKFSLAVHYAELGDARRALTIHRALCVEGTHQRGVWLMNEVSFALDAGETTPDDLARWIKQLGEARALLEQSGEGDRKAYIPITWQHVAAIHLLQHRPADALTALDTADTIAPASSDRLELRGRALAAQGHRDQAITAWKRALETIHPDRRLATRIRADLRGAGG